MKRINKKQERNKKRRQSMTLYGSGFDESGMRIKDAMAEIVEDE